MVEKAAERVPETATRPASRHVPPISGPSMLGLNQPGIDQPSRGQPGPPQPAESHPSMDSLRERSFSGFDSYLETEEPRRGRRILLFVVLLAALGAAGWWTYGYLGTVESRKSEAPAEGASKNAGGTPADRAAETPSTKAAPQNAAPESDAGSSKVSPPAAEVPEGPSENANSGAEAPPEDAGSEAKPAVKTAPQTPRTARREKIAANHEPAVASAKASKLREPAATDTGDADFRRGETYLYGRGAAENCNEAVKNLKAASAKSNAKARSTFGTMYATGHCVPRDLPTSYLWFAMALRVDPNNQILEKDLNAVWNQMTPPERQMATRMKQ